MKSKHFEFYFENCMVGCSLRQEMSYGDPV